MRTYSNLSTEQREFWNVLFALSFLFGETRSEMSKQEEIKSRLGTNRYLLTEARSELDMQELRVEGADRALQESGLQSSLKGWNFTSLERRERVLQEGRVRSLLEIEELKKMCCTEAERAKQLRIDELSIQEKEN